MSSSMLNWLAPKLIRALGYLPLSVGRSLGTGLGRITWLLQGRSAKVTLRNLELCFPELTEHDRRRLAKESLIETGKTVFEAAQVWTKSQHWLEEHVVAVEGEELVKAMEASGRGIIFMAPHIGNWEVTSRFINSRTDRSLTAMFAPGKLPKLDKLIRDGREKSGCSLVPANLKGVMAQIKTLKRGHNVGILPDQTPDESGGCYAPFYGQQALTMTLIHSLIQRSGCAAFTIVAERVESKKGQKAGWKLILREPEQDIYSDDVDVSAAAMNRAIETTITPIISQYQWEYKRFKRQSDGRNLYAK